MPRIVSTRFPAAHLAGRVDLENVLALAARCMEADHHVRRNLYMPLILDDLAHDIGKLVNPRGR